MPITKVSKMHMSKYKHVCSIMTPRGMVGSQLRIKVLHANNYRKNLYIFSSRQQKGHGKSYQPSSGSAYSCLFKSLGGTIGGSKFYMERLRETTI